MRILAIMASAALAATGVAQTIQLTTPPNFAGGNRGNDGGGVYFDLTVSNTLTISQIDFNVSHNGISPGGMGTFTVWLGPNSWQGNVSNASLWTSVSSWTGQITTQAPTTATMNTAILNPPIGLAPGMYGVAIESQQGVWGHEYTNGNGANQTIADANLQFDGGGAQNVFLTGGVFTPRIFNGTFHYSLGGTPIAVANFEEYGQGCYDFQESFYEDYPNPATSFDLSGMTLRLVLQNPTFPSYNVLQGSGNWNTPTSMPLTLAPPPGGGEAVVIVGPTPFPIILPDGNGGVTTTSFLEVCENGWVTPTDQMGTISNAADPGNRDISAFLNGAARWAPAWHDMDSAGAPATGGVFLDTIMGGPVPGFTITWLQLPSRGAANANDVQIAFFASGDVEYRWIIQGGNTQAVGQGVGGGWPTLVGFTTGGGASDPGLRDLSLTASGMNTFNTDPIDNEPLRLFMSARPQLGTTPNLVTSNIPVGGMLPGGPFTQAQLGILLFGFGRIPAPGNSLAGLGMPGCFQHITFNVTASVFFPAGAATNNFAFPIPNSPSLNGATVHAQAGTLSPMSPGFNPLGGLSSNGLTIQLGSL